MRLPLPYYLVCLILVLMVTLNLNCQRVKSLPSLLTPIHPPLIRLAPDEYPPFMDNGDKEKLKQALKNQITYFSQLKQATYYPLGNNTVSSETLRITLEKFLRIMEDNEDKDLDQLIKTHFDAYQSTGENGTGMVTFTGYYIPQVEGSLKADEEYCYPLYRLPDDLIIKEGKPRGLKRAVRIENGKECPYYTRLTTHENRLTKKGYYRARGMRLSTSKIPLIAISCTFRAQEHYYYLIVPCSTSTSQEVITTPTALYERRC